MEPTKLNTISFSTLCDWQKCPKYFELKNIKRLEAFTQSVNTIYGTLLHKYVQKTLTNEMSIEDASNKFLKTWTRFCSMYKQPDYVKFGSSGVNVIQKTKGVIESEIGKIKTIFIEKRLSTQALPKYTQLFRGYIDIVIELENGKYAIIDLKSSDTAYMFMEYKKKDSHKDYQLTLYKHYFCQTASVNPDLVETYFIVMEKNVRAKKGVCVERITSGPKKIKNALEWVDSSLEGIVQSINQNKFLRRRTNCNMYGENNLCPFANTECKKNFL